MSLLTLLQEYLNDEEYLEKVQKIKKKRGQVQPEILSFLKEFLAARREIEEWKEKIQIINIHWGIGRAMSIILGVYNECKEMGRLGAFEAFIRRHIAVPQFLQLKRMEPLVDFVRANYRSNQRLRLLFILSIFWHLQEPDTYPIFYPKSRAGMRILREKGYLPEPGYLIEDYYEEYLDFVFAYRELRGVLKAKAISPYQIEHFLSWLAEKEKK